MITAARIYPVGSSWTLIVCYAGGARSIVEGLSAVEAVAYRRTVLGGR